MSTETRLALQALMATNKATSRAVEKAAAAARKAGRAANALPGCDATEQAARSAKSAFFEALRLDQTARKELAAFRATVES